MTIVILKRYGKSVFTNIFNTLEEALNYKNQMQDKYEVEIL